MNSNPTVIRADWFGSFPVGSTKLPLPYEGDGWYHHVQTGILYLMVEFDGIVHYNAWRGKDPRLTFRAILDLEIRNVSTNRGTDSPNWANERSGA